MNASGNGLDRGGSAGAARSGHGSSRRERRHFTAQQKVAIVKQHLVDGVPVSDLCDEHQILPAQFYQWQKQLFEGGAAAFESRRAGSKPAGPSSAERQVQQLEAKLAAKNEVISELMEEAVRLKKTNGAP
jgi:transposase-like protein